MNALEICSVEPGASARLELVLWTLDRERCVLGTFDADGRAEAEVIAATIGEIVLDWFRFGLESGAIVGSVGGRTPGKVEV